MYVRHLAWLHATPEKSKESRLKRFKGLDENDSRLSLPDIETEYAATYVVELLHEAGLMLHSGMGPVPLSWSEIQNWLTATGRELPLWEKLTIKRLSEEYVAELSMSHARDREQPYVKPTDTEGEELQHQRDVVQNKFLALLSNRKSNRDKEESQL